MPLDTSQVNQNTVKWKEIIKIISGCLNLTKGKKEEHLHARSAFRESRNLSQLHEGSPHPAILYKFSYIPIVG